MASHGAIRGCVAPNYRGWVGDEYWTALADRPTDTEHTLNTWNRRWLLHLRLRWFV